MANRSFIYFLVLPVFAIILLSQLQSEQNNCNLLYPASEQLEISVQSLSDWPEEEGCLRHTVSRSKKVNESAHLAKWCIPTVFLCLNPFQEYVAFAPIIPPTRSMLCIYRI